MMDEKFYYIYLSAYKVTSLGQFTKCGTGENFQEKPLLLLGYKENHRYQKILSWLKV